MKFHEAVKSAFVNVLSLGRATRSEFWYFVLFSVLLHVVTLVLDFTLDDVMGVGFNVFTMILTVILLIPSITLAIRRLHDTGRSGFWLLFWFL